MIGCRGGFVSVKKTMITEETQITVEIKIVSSVLLVLKQQL